MGMREVDTDSYASRVHGTRVVRDLDRQQWSAFVDHHPDGTIFHTPEMYRVFEKTRRHRPAVLAALDADGEIAALMTPVEITTLAGPFRALTTRTISFGGPLVVTGPEAPDALAALLRSFKRDTGRTTLFTEFRNLSETSALGPTLTACEFRHEPHLNFLVDLTLDEQALFKRIKSSARRNIQKARRLGVTVSEAQDASDRGAGYEVLRDVYSRLRVPLPDQSIFDAAHEVLGPLGRYRMVLAKIDEQTIGVMCLLLYKDVVYYWYTGTLREHAECRAGDLLVWHAIELGHARGCRLLDFGGAGKPDEPYGVRDFKAKYGGSLVDFGRDTWVPAPGRLRFVTMSYEKVRRFL
jgi:serine/alanine adding enzyme